MGRLTTIRQQENPDGVEGHKERERLQKESKREPVKRKYTGKDQHWFTKPPQANLTNRQRRNLKRLDMKENCEDYTDDCKPSNCMYCEKRDARTRVIVETAKVIIETYEKEHSNGTEFREDNIQ